MTSKLKMLRKLAEAIQKQILEEIEAQKRRSATAVAMKKRRAGAGAHKDRKKEASRKKARGPVDVDYDEW